MRDICHIRPYSVRIVIYCQSKMFINQVSLWATIVSSWALALKTQTKHFLFAKLLESFKHWVKSNLFLELCKPLC